MKDSQNQKLTYYQNKNVLRFIESKGVKIMFHIHEYKVLTKDYVILRCEGCGRKLDFPGLSPDEAEVYIDQYFSNTGYVYQEK